MSKTKDKFEFGTDFQEMILQYTVTDPKGYKALELYHEDNFTLIPHSIIAYSLKRFFKKHKHIPEEVLLREFLREIYTQSDRVLKDVTKSDKDEVSKIISKIYQKKVKEPEIVLDKCIKFARWIAFKQESENMDINNFDSWNNSILALQKATSIGNDLQEDFGTFLVAGMPDRAHKRHTDHMVCQTPWWQLNALLNSGGTEKGNVITLLSKEKFFKTGTLINISKGYMKMRKKGFYVDLENGEKTIVTRAEQSIYNKEQKEIQSGEFDDSLLKLFRKYKRIGSELAVKKFPSLKTTTDDIKLWLNKLKQEYGFIPDFGIIDYGLLLGAVSGKDDDFGRISDAFLDIKNLSAELNLDCIWTAAHVDRKGSDQRTATTYKSTDIAKCIDIPRHIDCLLGLQQNDEEAEAGVMRVEVIEQRNGMRSGKMFFWMDIAKQRLTEFTKTQIARYYEDLGKENPDEEQPVKKKTRKTDL